MSPIFVPGRMVLDNGTRAAAIAGVSPTLDYRFAREKREIETVSLTDKLTFTGGNQGTLVGSDGFIQPATTNVPRFDHDPLSRQSLGLLSEVERTNGIRNNTMVGAVAGTPGTNPTNWNIQQSVTGLTFQVVSVGTESGIKYIDIRASGTPSASGTILIQLEQNTTNAAAQGETWVISSYCRLMAGTLPGLTTLLARIGGSGGSFLTFSQTAIVPTSSPLISQRFTHVASLDNASTEFLNARIDASVISGVAVDFTLRIGLPQLEKGATASTPIRTTTTAVTRTADSAVIDGTGVLTGTYTLVEKPAGCAVVSGSNINLEPGFTAERIMVFPAALDAGQITAIRGAM